jgi:membrane-anchored protein YejM (alkaline phosphatase superfamily)
MFPETKQYYKISQDESTHDDIWQAYRENLDLVLSEVEDLLSDLQGKTVITADHGELLGDRERPIPIRTYWHPEGVYVDSLVKVPWHVYENGERKDVVAEEPVDWHDDVDMKEVEQNLRDLGYRA